MALHVPALQQTQGKACQDLLGIEEAGLKVNDDEKGLAVHTGCKPHRREESRCIILFAFMTMPHMTANSGTLTRQRLLWQASPVIVSYTLGWLALRSTWATMEGDGDEDNSRRLQSGVFLFD